MQLFLIKSNFADRCCWQWCERFFLTGALCLSAGRGVLRLTRLPRHDRGPVPGRNRSAASCPCTVLRRASYHYSTRSPWQWCERWLLFFCSRRPLPFGGSHLRLPSGPAGIRTTTGSLSALARPTPYQLSHRVAWCERWLLPSLLLAVVMCWLRWA